MRHAKSLIIGIIGPQHKSEYNIMMPIRYLKKRHAENIKKNCGIKISGQLQVHHEWDKI